MKPLRNQFITTMNKTERKYADYLYMEQLRGQIISYEFEPIKWKLAFHTFYTPDFFIVYPDHFKFVEIKGFKRDDAIVKFKMAREKYPYFKWEMIGYKNRQWVKINI